MEQSTRQGAILESAAATVVTSLLNEELSSRFDRDPAERTRYLEGDDAVEVAAIAAACERAAVAPEDYLTTLEADAALQRLHDATLTEVVAGTADPGPNDRISREAPSGDESNRHFNDWMRRKNSP